MYISQPPSYLLLNAMRGSLKSSKSIFVNQEKALKILFWPQSYLKSNFPFKLSSWKTVVRGICVWDTPVYIAWRATILIHCLAIGIFFLKKAAMYCHGIRIYSPQN